METKIITLKNNYALIELSNYTGRSKDEVRSIIIEALLSKKIIHDRVEYCGSSLGRVLTYYMVDFESFAKHCFKTVNARLLNILKHIYIWGIHFECPKCGCKMKVDSGLLYCKNHIYCGFIISLIPEMRAGKNNLLNIIYEDIGVFKADITFNN